MHFRHLIVYYYKMVKIKIKALNFSPLISTMSFGGRKASIDIHKLYFKGSSLVMLGYVSQ